MRKLIVDCCEASAAKITAFSRAATLIVPQKFYHTSQSSSWKDIWVLPDPDQDFMNVLNDGASKVILNVPKYVADQEEIIKFFPLDRIIWKVDDPNTSIDLLLQQNCQFLIDIDSFEQVYSMYKSCDQFLFSVDSLDAVDISSISKQALGVVINQNLLSIDHGVGITLGDMLCDLLTSDRPDGLYPTIVTDEQGVALGLCYSSKESINEAIRIGCGVYWSRSRGLWRKGESSGCTQELLSISMDCDSDTLCFAVRQTGPGIYYFLLKDFVI